jgi:hypothetical protein
MKAFAHGEGGEDGGDEGEADAQLAGGREPEAARPATAFVLAVVVLARRS